MKLTSSEITDILNELESYLCGDTLEIICYGNDGFGGQEIIRDPGSRNIVMKNIKLIFENVIGEEMEQ